MSKEFFNSIELPDSPEKFGRNVNINAIFLRHGEKVLSTDSSHTGLTPEGMEMSAEFGRHLTKKDAVKPYASDTERTIDTVILAVNESPTEKKLSLSIKDDLKAEYDEKGTFMASVLALKKLILGQDFVNLPPEEQERRLHDYYTQQQDLYLSYGNRRPDAKTQSPLETAAKIAQRVDIYIRMADHLKSGSQVDLLNATHDWSIASFLKEILVREIDGQEARGFNSVNDIGGPIGYTEHFDINITIDGRGEKFVELIFRNQKYQLDQGRLQELVKMADKLKANKN